MSQNNIQEQQEQVGGTGPENPILAGLRKASDSTIEITEYLKQKQLKKNSSSQSEEEYDEDQYKQLSSGVYHISRQSEQPHEEPEPEKDYYSQEVKIGTDPKEIQKRQSGQDFPAQTSIKTRQGQYEQIELSEGEPEKATSEKLQQSGLQCQKETKGEHEEENNFEYPSLMEDELAGMQQRFSLKPQGEIKLAGQYKQEKSQEEVEIMHSEEQFKSLDNEELKEADDHEMQKLAQKVKEELSRQKITEESQQKPTEEALIELERNQSKQVPVQESPLIPFIRSHRLQQIGMEESQQVPRARQVVEAPSRPFLRIIGYEKEYFLKIETQVYQIEYVSASKSYIFCRKFSDFVILHKMVRQQYIGYILYPFPENNLEFFKRLKLSVGSELEKIVIIEQRLLELQNYLNCLISHQEISKSQIFEIFIAESKELFRKQFPVLEQALDNADQRFNSNRLRESYSNIKSLVKSGISFLSNYMAPASTHQNATLMLEVQRNAEQLLKSYEEVCSQLLKDQQICHNFEIKVEKLIEIYQYNKNLKPIQSSIDSVLKFCSKTASSKAYYEDYQTWLEDHLLRQIKYFVRTFNQIDEMLEYRASLLNRAGALDIEEIRLGVALIDRVQQFDSRFLQDWPEAHRKFNERYEQMLVSYREKWQKHCTLMSKIWK